VAAAALFGAAQAGPEEELEDWKAALRALPAQGGQLYNCFNSLDPALLAMYGVGKVFGAEGQGRLMPVGLRPARLAPQDARLVNVDAAPFFKGVGLAHSYKHAYHQLLHSPKMAQLWAHLEGAGQ